MPVNRRDSPPPITLQYPSLYAMALPPWGGQERNLQVCEQGLCQVGTQKTTSQRNTSSTVGVQCGEGDLTHAEFQFCLPTRLWQTIRAHAQEVSSLIQLESRSSTLGLEPKSLPSKSQPGAEKEGRNPEKLSA